MEKIYTNTFNDTILWVKVKGKYFLVCIYQLDTNWHLNSDIIYTLTQDAIYELIINYLITISKSLLVLHI